MEFGKVHSIEQLNRIQFKLPSPDPRSTFQSHHDTVGTVSTVGPLVYVGCPIWGKKEWAGTLYPSNATQKEYLHYYSQQLNSIELNTTFYRIPENTTVERWQNSVPSDFRFCPKVFQKISQFQTLTEIPELVHRFCSSMLRLESKLGMSFLQLPPSFEPRHLVILKRFFTLLPSGFQLAIEFRHPSWFHQGQLIAPAFDLLSKNGVSTVITDVAGRRDVLHQSLTTSKVLVRFVGNALHSSDFPRLSDWIERIGEWLKVGVSQVYFFVHQPNEVGSLELISRFVDQLNATHQLSIRTWKKELSETQFELFAGE